MLKEKRLILDWTKAHDVCPLEKKLSDQYESLFHAHQDLISRRGPSSELTGWLSVNDSHESINRMMEQIENIYQHSDAVVVVGVGGCLLGAKALHQALTHSFANYRHNMQSRHLTTFWAGHHLASDEFAELLDVLDEYTPTLVVISNSESTTESTIGFRILKHYLDKRFGIKEADARVLVVTDSSAPLYNIAQERQYPCFEVPKDVRGGYSVFTAVGLLPLALAGVSIKEILDGAKAASEDAISEKNSSLETNAALCYAGIRNILYHEGYKIEALCVWTPKLRALADWWVELFAVSDAKEQGGVFPVAMQFSTDLHSVGQYFQDGERNLFATHLKISDEYSLLSGAMKRKIQIPESYLSDDLSFVDNTALSFVQSEAQQATILAHSDSLVPTLSWELPELNAWWLGYWIYTNMFACAVGDYARGIDPFKQSGLDSYKNNMFSLLGKPGYQQATAQIKNRMQSTNRLRSFGMTCLNQSRVE